MTRMITLEFYGFAKKVEITDDAYYSGHVVIAILRPLKIIAKEDFGKSLPALDYNHNQLDFYRDLIDDIWRPIPS